MVIDGECESPFFTSASLFEDIGGLRMRLHWRTPHEIAARL
jgi:hypothetical protein